MIQYKCKVEASKDQAQPERGKAQRPTAYSKTVVEHTRTHFDKSIDNNKATLLRSSFESVRTSKTTD